MPALVLKPGREKSLLRHHPWIFSGAVFRVDGNPAAGDTLDILSSRGDLLGRAAYSPYSQIRARMWSFDPNEPIGVDFFRKRIRSAIASRGVWDLERNANAFRLIYAESDGLPGLIVDRYADSVVMQVLSTGAERWREEIADSLLGETGLRRIYERSDVDARELEGLESRTGVIRRASVVEVSPDSSQDSVVTIQEHGMIFLVDISRGHKTGFYLDQRANRQRVRALAHGRDVLDCFCYTGGFTLNALAGGAKSVLALDSSSEALGLARENLKRNDLPTEKANFVEGDVFRALRQFRDEGRAFDMIVLDPPKFAPTAAQAGQAARGYKDINLLAFKLLRPGGLLVTFSCSGGVDAALFQKIVAAAALDANAEAQIVEHLSQAADHPISLQFPEAAYLKGLICHKID